jgi:hypothetical protein
MYATVAQLRVYLDQVEVTDVTTAALTSILTRATATVKRALQSMTADPSLDFADYAAATTKIVTAYGGVVLNLPPHLAGSVTQVESLTTSNPTTWDALTDEWYEQDDGSLYRTYGWASVYMPAPTRYRVTAQWGYGPAPSDIEEVTLELAVNTWRSTDKGGFTEMVGVEGQGSVKVIANLTPGQKDALKAWADTVRPVAL